MKEEIEKILKDCTDIDEDSEGNRYSFFENDKAASDLQKLFLTKQIELLEGIITGNGWVATCNKLRATITQLQSELAAL